MNENKTMIKECSRCYGDGRIAIEALEKFDYFIVDDVGIYTKKCPDCNGKGVLVT